MSIALNSSSSHLTYYFYPLINALEVNYFLTQQIELENTLEQEQEALVNKLWKRMDKLEAEKR